jgi:ATP-dependent RNA helicase DDX41
MSSLGKRGADASPVHDGNDEGDDNDMSGLFIPLKHRRKMAQQPAHQLKSVKAKTLDERAAEVLAATASLGGVAAPEVDKAADLGITVVPEAAPERPTESLLSIANRLRAEHKLVEPNAENDEKILLEHINDQRVPLASAEEHAKGIVYTESLPSSWRPPAHYREMPESARDAIRKKFNILVDGDDVPPPIRSFTDTRPTPIQMQGIPIALSGRDMIGIAFTGSGKTLAFSLPMLSFALEQEFLLPVGRNEGPFSLILCPSRELARQTFDVIDFFAKVLEKSEFPRIKTVLCIGGVDNQARDIQDGCHIIVATPGRLLDLLNRHKANLDLCRLLVLDEADR